MSALPVHVALTLSFAESLALAVLLLRVKGVPGMRLLVTFLVGVAIWVASCELTTWLGPGSERIATTLVAALPQTSAVFFHFVIVLCGLQVPARRYLLGAYGVAAATSVLALIVPAGRFVPWRDFASFFEPNLVGWVVGIVWSLLAVAGHAVMFVCWLQGRGPPGGQLVAMCVASGWGLLCMTGYAIRGAGFDFYPFPLLGMPLYPAILVYGILRYELMIVNAWARRALAWALLVTVGGAVMLAMAAIPLAQSAAGTRLVLTVLSVLLVAGLVLDPLRRLATRVVYPGSALGDDAAPRWQAALTGADSYAALSQRATTLLATEVRVPVKVVVGDGDTKSSGMPTLVCQRDGRGWATRLAGWEAAPPGPRYAAQLFGATLAEAASRLEQAMSLALRERDRQQQERLAELGALAATVAHDIRNPLNIIAMAAAAAPTEVRKEIATQTARITQLATDLLDYAKSWQVEPRAVDLGDQVRTSVGRYTEIEFGRGLEAGLVVAADPRRLTQALTNLVENARVAVADNNEHKRIAIDGERRADGAVELRVCDNGCGIPDEIRDSLFQPFVSRRPEGTGLGLAIVAKIMQAHGGDVRVASQDGWSTCFVLTFPRSQST